MAGRRKLSNSKHPPRSRAWNQAHERGGLLWAVLVDIVLIFAVCVVKTAIQSIIVGFCKMSKKDAIKHELSKYNDFV